MVRQAGQTAGLTTSPTTFAAVGIYFLTASATGRKAATATSSAACSAALTTARAAFGAATCGTAGLRTGSRLTTLILCLAGRAGGEADCGLASVCISFSSIAATAGSRRGAGVGDFDARSGPAGSRTRAT